MHDRDPASNLEYSLPLEQSEQIKAVITEIDRYLADSRAQLTKAKQEREEAMADNEFAEREGFAKTDIVQIDGHIAACQQIISELESLKSKFSTQGVRLEALHSELQGLLLRAKGITEA